MHTPTPILMGPITIHREPASMPTAITGRKKPDRDQCSECFVDQNEYISHRGKSRQQYVLECKPGLARRPLLKDQFEGGGGGVMKKRVMRPSAALWHVVSTLDRFAFPVIVGSSVSLTQNLQHFFATGELLPWLALRLASADFLRINPLPFRKVDAAYAAFL